MAIYHWILTLEGHSGPEQAPATVGGRGALDLPPGETRETVTDRIVEEVRSSFLARTGHLLQDSNILFFSLEPNQIPQDG